MKRVVVVLIAIALLVAGYIVGSASGIGDRSDEPSTSVPKLISPTDSSPIMPGTGGPDPKPNAVVRGTPDELIRPLPPNQGDGSALARAVSVNLYTKRVGETTKRIDDVIAANNGTVYSSQLRSGSYSVEARIPIANYHATVQALRSTGTTEQFTTNVDDVSGQLAYSEADLRDAQAREQSLLALIEQAPNAAAKATLEQQLADTRRQIELINASLRATKARVDTVTFSIAASNIHLDAPVANASMLTKAWDQTVRLFLTITGGLLIIGAVLVPFVLLLFALMLAGRVARRTTSHESLPEANAG